jgi:formamidopyrimidine-DNA glycosylase
MPELPDVTIYVERLDAMVRGQRLETMRIGNPFVLRTYEPGPEAFAGRTLQKVDRIGKRIVLGFDGDLYAVMHLMIAGRLSWRPGGAVLPKKLGLAAFDFERGSLLFTEAGSKHRASLHLVDGQDTLASLDRGGVNALDVTVEEFAAALRRENRTLKRALTDPTIIDGVGNTYSDEILHRGRLSPFKLTQSLTDEEIGALYQASIAVLSEWIERFRAEVGQGFLEKVTAFRPEMAVHGKYRQPCPVCGAPVQRIVYAQNEANYCPVCQTEGRLLKDRALSRLLREDWPKTLEELEQRVARK